MRFLQQDTLLGDIQEPLTRNLYIYAGANPLTYTDPSGHSYYSYDGAYGYTWHPDTLVDEGITVVAAYAPLLGSSGKAAYYYIRYGDSNTTLGQYGTDLGIEAAGALTGGLLKYGRLGYKTYKVVSIADEAIDTASYISNAIDFIGVADNVGKGIYKSKTIRLKEITYEELLLSAIQDAGLEEWLTDKNKNIVESRVKFIEDYINEKGKNFTLEGLRKSFEGYYNKEGIFIQGYLQKEEGKSAPTRFYENTYNTKEGTYTYEATVKQNKGYISESWFDEMFYQSVRTSEGDGYNLMGYYKKTMIQRLETTSIEKWKEVKKKIEIYDNGSLLQTTIEYIDPNDYINNYEY